MANYSDRAYRAAVEDAAFFDLSARGKIELSGPDALIFLHNLCTNDVKNLAVGAGCEAFLCTAKARVVAFLNVSHVAEAGHDAVLLDCDPGQVDKVVAHLNHYLISEQVEITDRTNDLAFLHVCGPKAIRPLQLFHDPRFTVSEIGWCHVRRHDSLGHIGFDVCCPAHSRSGLTEKLEAAGAIKGDEATWDLLRIEAGTPIYGRDIDENRLVMEVGRTAQAISYAKGCFLGQEPIVMARDRGHANRTLLGIKLTEGGAVKAGALLFKDGAEAGQATSSVLSPRFGPIALAYLKRGFQDPGTVVQVDPATDGRPVEICTLPFVAR